MSGDRDNRLKPVGDDLKKREQEIERDRKKQEQLQKDREYLLGLPQFQRVMADILADGGMFRSVMTGNSQTFYLSGQQDFARKIWTSMAIANSELAHELLKPKFGEEDV